MFNVFRDGKVHVCRDKCPTCIFHPGNRMHLAPGRVSEMVQEALAVQSAIVCHSTLDGDNAVCHGFWEHHQTAPLQIAERLGHIVWEDYHG